MSIFVQLLVQKSTQINPTKPELEGTPYAALGGAAKVSLQGIVKKQKKVTIRIHLMLQLMVHLIGQSRSYLYI